MANGCLPSACSTWTGWTNAHYHSSALPTGLDERFCSDWRRAMNVPSAGKKRLVIVGATGMVGGYALRYALEHPAIGCATSIGRRELGISHPKLHEVDPQRDAPAKGRK
jgi:hypothetical protein